MSDERVTWRSRMPVFIRKRMKVWRADLLSEIDRLRGEVEWREDERRDALIENERLREHLRALRAELAALREAGEGLELDLIRRRCHSLWLQDCGFDHRVAGDREHGNLAHWREVASSGAATPSGESADAGAAEHPAVAPDQTLAGVRLDAEPGGAYAPVERPK